MATTVIYQKRGEDKVKIMETPDLSPYALKTDVEAELAEKANVDGNYPDMTVGNAEQLVSEDYLTDTAPYTFRTAGGNVDIGDREYDELVGGTICWNQLIFDNATWNKNRCSVAATGNAHEYVATCTTNTYRDWAFYRTNLMPQGHKYIVSFDYTAQIVNDASLYWTYSTTTGRTIPAGGTSSWQHFDGIYTAGTPSGAQASIAMYYSSAEAVTVGDTLTYKNLVLHDLTAMFGTAIADYIYALEQATAGAGVAWFRSHFPKDYYAYDPGSLQSVQVASHDMVGFNQWDEEKRNGYYGADGVFYATPTATTNTANTNPIPVFPNTAYYFKVPNNNSNSVLWYDADMKLISANTNQTMNTIITSPDNAHFLNFKANADYNQKYEICVNLSWSGYRNGEYEAYEKNSYPLDSTLTLRGIPKLDASNNLYYDGDTYEADGTVTRRYAVKDLGTANWVRDNSAVSGKYRFYAQITDIVASDLSNVTTIMSNGWQVLASGGTYTPNNGYTVIGSGYALYYYDENKINMTANEFKASMSGVYLVYQVATPTTETADAFQSPQIVSDFGTEQYVDAAVAAGTRDVAIPVGHDTRYMSNLKDKLRRLPNIPNNAGTYLVDYNSTTRRCSFTEYLDGAKITALESKIPDAPTTDGTYKLTCTIAEGEVTYTWESDS